MGGLCSLTVAEILAGYAARQFSPVDVVEAHAARIADVEPAVNAFTTRTIEAALEDARAAERAWLGGRSHGSLTGVPFVAKDLFDTAGVRTTYGSAIFREHVPEADATAVRRLRETGAILLGKTATHEFAWGITTDNPHYGPTRNPWNLERVPGGSSGGSAVAVATGEAPVALATDTGGSIRLPAAFCGAAGLKPTWGRVSAAGVFSLARSLDHVGVIACTPSDALLVLAVIAGPSLDDQAAVPRPAAELRPQDGGLEGLTVAVCPDLHSPAPAPDILAAYEAAVRAAEEAGARVREVEFGAPESIMATYATIQSAEALDAHRRAGIWPERRDGYGDDVAARLDAAADVTLGDYLEACEERRRLVARFAAVFTGGDLVLTPTAAVSPMEVGAEAAVYEGRRVPFRDVVMPYTAPHNLAGLPSCTVRAGFDSLGIPVGVQIAGPPWSEALVARAAQALFDATPGVQAPRPAPGAQERAHGGAGLPPRRAA